MVEFFNSLELVRSLHEVWMKQQCRHSDTCQHVKRVVNSYELWLVDNVFQRAVVVSGCRHASWAVDNALSLGESECVLEFISDLNLKFLVFLFSRTMWLYKEGYCLLLIVSYNCLINKIYLLLPRGHRQLLNLVKFVCSHFFPFICLFLQLATILWCIAILCCLGF